LGTSGAGVGCGAWAAGAVAGCALADDDDGGFWQATLAASSAARIRCGFTRFLDSRGDGGTAGLPAGVSGVMG
jgi:hypothetical protein